MEKLSLLFDGVLLENKPLYHYTNTEGFLGIIKNNQIWATDYKFLNDPSEHSYGHALVKEVIEELIKGKNTDALSELYKFRFEPKILAETFTRGFYVLSLTENKDSLTHWKKYGNDGYGFAVEFTPKLVYKELPKALFGDIPHKLLKVIYDREEQKSLAKEILLEVSMYGDRVFELGFLVEYLCIKFKDPIYVDEEEWRVVYSPFIQLGNLGKDVYFREANNTIINYNSFSFESISGFTVGSKRPKHEWINLQEIFLRYLKRMPNYYESKVIL